MRAQRARRLIGFAFASAALVTALVHGIVEASCNAVPPPERRYPSTNGLVNRRIVAPWTAPDPQATPAPDDRVEIEIPLACASGALFTPGVSVEIRFREPVPGATASPSWLEITTDRVLRFTMPDAGRSGPVDVVVLDGKKQPIAEIGPLYEATTSCNGGGSLDPTFGRLTVLPPANDLRALAAGTAPLVMTVDGAGGLLVPLAHPFPVPTAVPLGANALVAYLERGSGYFAAFGGQTTTLAASLAAAAKPPADGTLSDQLVRTFTEHGRPLPTLVHVDAAGALWGSVDAPRSVLRVAPRDVNGAPIHDFASRLGPDGRIVVTPRPTPSPPFTAATSAPFLLQDFRGGAETVAWLRDERIEGDFDGDQLLTATRVVTVRAARAGRDPGYELRSAVRDAKGRALLGTTRSGGAYLGANSGDRGTLRAFELPPVGAPVPIATPAHLGVDINRRSLAISEPLAFFGKFQSGQKAKLQSYDLSAGTFHDAKLPAFDHSIVARGCALAIADSDHEVWWHCPASSPKKGSLGVYGDDAALAGRLAVVATRPSPSPGVALRAIGGGNPGPLHRIPRAASAVGATAYCDPTGRPCDDAPCAGGATCRRVGLFLEPLPSPSLGTLTWVAEPTPGATPAPVAVQPATDFVARGGIVAFRSPRTTGPGKELFVLDLRQRPPRLCSTGSTATAPGAVDWEDFYEIRGRLVFFLTDERDEGHDLNGDGKTDRLVLQMFDVEACSDPALLGALPPTAPAQPIGTVLVPADVEPQVLRVNLEATSSTLFADEEGDQVPYPFDRCAVVVNPRQIDDDLDGLGDGAESCDPTYCTPYRPRTVRRGSFAARRCVRRLRPAADRYFEARVEMTNLCLPTVGAPGAPADVERRVDRQCLGAFANLTENRPEIVRTTIDDVEAAGDLGPQLLTAVRTLLRAEDRLGEIAASDPCDDPRRAARIVRAEAGAVAALTRAFSVLRVPGFAPRRAAARYVREAVDAMEDCLARCQLFPPSGETLAAQCLGYLAGAAGSVTFVPPTHPATAQRLATLRQALVETVEGADCPSDGERPCGTEIACLAWRRAVDVVLANH